jgi:mRNA-degrading endonuclease RelE of RelBE toxin-antitoxin system
LGSITITVVVRSTITVVFLGPVTLASRQCICEDMCVFEIRFAEGVEADLKSIRIYYRNQILDAIEERLAYEPDTRTRNRKLIENLIPPWRTVAPIWELRVGEYRLFYDLSPTESVVYVRAVRRKPRGTKTEDIL